MGCPLQLGSYWDSTVRNLLEDVHLVVVENNYPVVRVDDLLVAGREDRTRWLLEYWSDPAADETSQVSFDVRIRTAEEVSGWHGSGAMLASFVVDGIDDRNLLSVRVGVEDSPQSAASFASACRGAFLAISERVGEEFALGRKRLELIGMVSRHFDSGGEVVEIARTLREMNAGVAETVRVICAALNLDFFAVTEIVENLESAD